MKFEMTVVEVKRYGNQFDITCVTKEEKEVLAFRFVSTFASDLTVEDYMRLPLRVGEKITVDIEKVKP